MQQAVYDQQRGSCGATLQKLKHNASEVHGGNANDNWVESRRQAIKLCANLPRQYLPGGQDRH